MIGFQFQSPNLLPHRFLTSMDLPHFLNNVTTDRTGPFHVIEVRQLSKHYICLFNCLPFRVVQLSVSQLFPEIFYQYNRKNNCGSGPLSSLFSDNGSRFMVSREEICRNRLKIGFWFLEKQQPKKRVQWRMKLPLLHILKANESGYFKQSNVSSSCR